MRRDRIALIVALLLAGATTASAQFMGMGRAPRMNGVWKPVVGSGGVYELQSKREGKQNLEIAVVGTETVDGATGHWLEMLMNTPQGETVVKQLFVLEGKSVGIRRVIVQPPDGDPMEMPVGGMMQRREPPQQQSSDAREGAERVGTETITVPAGTFACEHWRSQDRSSEFWISEKVSPWGMVKMTSQDTNMILMKTITNAKSRITKAPVKFDPQEMMRRRNPN